MLSGWVSCGRLLVAVDNPQLSENYHANARFETAIEFAVSSEQISTTLEPQSTRGVTRATRIQWSLQALQFSFQVSTTFVKHKTVSLWLSRAQAKICRHCKKKPRFFIFAEMYAQNFRFYQALSFSCRTKVLTVF